MNVVLNQFASAARPHTPEEAIVDSYDGAEIADPYRWLEDSQSGRTREWIKQQTAYTRLYFDALTGRNRIRTRVEQLLAVEVFDTPFKVGNRCFFLKRPANGEQSVIAMREGLDGDDLVLVNPARMTGANIAALSILSISDDGRMLAYGIRQGGEDSQAVEILDVERRQVLPHRLGHGFHRGLVFSTNGKGFYYVHGDTGGTEFRSGRVYWHAFGTSSRDDEEIFRASDDPRVRVGLMGSFGGALLGYFVTHCYDTVRTTFYIHDVCSGTPPKLVVENLRQLFVPQFAHNRIVALTDLSSPNRSIVEINPECPQQENWQVIVPETSLQIQDFAVLDDRILVTYIDNCASRIDAFEFSGQRQYTIAGPCAGTMELFPTLPGSDTVFYSFTSFTHPLVVFSCHVRSGVQKVWASRDVPFNSSCLEVQRMSYESKDGTLIPIWLVSQKGRVRREALPTLLTAYGGFGRSVTPQFTAHGTFLLEQGCLFAIANIRGGSEFGQEWHDAGRRHNKQTAIDDFLAGADWLVKQGYTDPSRLAIAGGSNAGLLVGAALTQRPDLFRAVICLGPLLDMLRYHLFDSAYRWVDEYGSADDHTDLSSLMAYSPYHHVAHGVAYPAVMLISGDADTRCNPLHARKMAARLQAATNSNLPVLLDYKPRWGHTAVQPLGVRIESLTDRLAFLCHELGVGSFV